MRRTRRSLGTSTRRRLLASTLTEPRTIWGHLSDESPIREPEPAGSVNPLAPEPVRSHALPLPPQRPPNPSALQLRQERPQLDLPGRPWSVLQHPDQSLRCPPDHRGAAGNGAELER